MVDLYAFDMLAYLEDRNVHYHTAGAKNTGEGWISIQCPFLDCDDSSNHCGIRTDSKAFSCFKCGRSGNGLKLIQQLEGGIAFNEVYDIIGSFKQDFPSMSAMGRSTGPNIENSSYASRKVLFKGASKNFPASYLKYLRSRRFHPSKLIKKYNLYAAPLVGKYRLRIIAPTYDLDGQMNSFVGCDITRQSDKKYKMKKGTPPGILYNLQNLTGDSAIFFEGVTDVWRVGDGSIGLLRTKFTEEQLDVIARLELKRAFILLDEDAEKVGERLGNQLTATIDDVRQLFIKGGDPEQLQRKDVLHIKKLLTGIV